MEANNQETLQKAREGLLKQLLNNEKNYIQEYYIPKEEHFIEAYIKNYPNLGLATTQRGESNHHATKDAGLNLQIPLYETVGAIVRRDSELADRIHDSISKEVGRVHILIHRDRDAFVIIRQRITKFAQLKLLPE